MSRNVISGLIQCANPHQRRDACRWPRSRRRRTRSTCRSSRRPARQGVQILCLQEIFNGPYFCPSQDAKWYAPAEPVPGPTIELLQQLRQEARDGHRGADLRAGHGRRLLQHRRGDRRRRQATSGKYRKNHIPQVAGFWEKFFFKPGNLGYPVFETALRQGRRLHLLRPPLPRGRAAAGPERRGDRLQPVGHGRGAVAVPLEARAARPRRGQRLLHGLHQPRRHRGALEHRPVLRHELLLSTRAARSSPRRSEDKDELVVADLDLDLIEEVRNTWQFYRDRRPETYERHDRALALTVSKGGGNPWAILIKNGTIVTASDRSRSCRRPLIEGGKIAAIGADLASDGRRRGRSTPSGQLVLPGGVDAHVHFELPFMGTVSADDFETGTAAARGGRTTSIIDFVIPAQGQAPARGAGGLARQGRGKAVADYGFHMASPSGATSTAEEMRRMRAGGGHHLLQDLHGLPRGCSARRRRIIQAMRRRARAAARWSTVHAEQRRHDRRAAERGSSAQGKTGAQVPRAHAPAPARGRGHRAGDHAWRDGGRRRSTSCT